jgi:hypothetical protein
MGSRLMLSAACCDWILWFQYKIPGYWHQSVKVIKYILASIVYHFMKNLTGKIMDFAPVIFYQVLSSKDER